MQNLHCGRRLIARGEGRRKRRRRHSTGSKLVPSLPACGSTDDVMILLKGKIKFCLGS